MTKLGNTKIKGLIIIAFFKLIILNCYSQNFQNADLDGIVNGNSCLPNFWLNVPYYDVNCLAYQVGNDTPDLTSLTGPQVVVGMNGNPYSGTTFLSGFFGRNPPNFFQEGIMQNVSGFNIGQYYSIRFHQTVVKANYSIDNSGSWAVYLDTILVGITTPTPSNEPYNSVNLPWELRSLSFTATANSHLIKFLPMDDDTIYAPSLTDTLGGLYMGIDSIGLEVFTGLNEQGQNKFGLTPNPNIGNFRLQFKGPIDKPMRMFLFDVYGKLIDEIIITNEITNYENTMLSNGMYFYSLRRGVEELGNGKIIVLH